LNEWALRRRYFCQIEFRARAVGQPVDRKDLLDGNRHAHQRTEVGSCPQQSVDPAGGIDCFLRHNRCERAELRITQPNTIAISTRDGLRAKLAAAQAHPEFLQSETIDRVGRQPFSLRQVSAPLLHNVADPFPGTMPSSRAAPFLLRAHGPTSPVSVVK